MDSHFNLCGNGPMKPWSFSIFAIAYTAVICGGLALLWFPYGENIDWPAWVQAVGSIIAIIASATMAIVIDQGSARRAAAQEKRRHDDAVTDWRKMSVDTVVLLRSIRRSVDGNATDEWQSLEREIKTQRIILGMYLRERPPHPGVGWLLVSLSTCLDTIAPAVNDLAGPRHRPDEARAVVEQNAKIAETVWGDFKAGRLTSAGN